MYITKTNSSEEPGGGGASRKFDTLKSKKS